MYRSLQQSARSVAAAVALTASVPALAGMGNTANTYGLFPVDAGTAQALSMFNAQASALYYNPAYLTMDPRGELTAGLLHGELAIGLSDDDDCRTAHPSTAASSAPLLHVTGASV